MTRFGDWGTNLVTGAPVVPRGTTRGTRFGDSGHEVVPRGTKHAHVRNSRDGVTHVDVPGCHVGACKSRSTRAASVPRSTEFGPSRTTSCPESPNLVPRVVPRGTTGAPVTKFVPQSPNRVTNSETLGKQGGFTRHVFGASFIHVFDQQPSLGVITCARACIGSGKPIKRDAADVAVRPVPSICLRGNLRFQDVPTRHTGRRPQGTDVSRPPMCDSVWLLQTGAAGQATMYLGAGTAPGAGVALCCCQLTDDCLTSEVPVALQSQMLLHCTCVIAVTLRIVALKGKVLTMLEVVVAYQYVTVFVCCRLAQQLVRPQGPWVQALPQVHEWDR